jgi:hypothetical protein
VRVRGRGSGPVCVRVRAAGRLDVCARHVYLATRREGAAKRTEEGAKREAVGPGGAVRGRAGPCGAGEGGRASRGDTDEVVRLPGSRRGSRAGRGVGGGRGTVRGLRSGAIWGRFGGDLGGGISRGG